MNEKTRWQRAAAHALQWMVSHLDRFVPVSIEPPYEPVRGKKLIELAVAVYLYSRFTGDHDSEPVRRVVAALRGLLERPDFADRLMRFPAEFIVVCDVYAVLRLLGHDDPAMRDVIQRAIDAGYVQYTERPPHRVMDVRLTLEWGAFRNALPDMDALCSASILSRIPSALYLHREAAYALTHVVMFLYEYGLRQHSTADSLDVASLQHTLSDLIVVYCQERDWNLLGEVLLCCDCVGLRATPVYEQGWEAFLSVQRADGAFPGPERVPLDQRESAVPQNEADGSPTPRDFERDYHTAVVGLIATSSHLARIERIERDSGLASAGDVDAPRAPRDSEIRYAPTSERLMAAAARAISRTRDGLGRLLDAAIHRDEDASPRRYYEIMLASWICHSLPSSSGGAFAETARRIGERLSARPEQDEAHLAQIPLTLTVMVAAILAAQGIAPPYLTAFVRRAADVLLRVPDDDPIADLALCEKRALFHSLGMHPAPHPMGHGELMRYVQTLALTAPREQIDGLLLRVNSQTGYGTSSGTPSPLEGWVEDVLAGLACHALRQYDFVRGCELVRALSYLGASTSATARACVNFLCLHQRADGTFGFFGPEEAILKGEDAGPALELDLRLPITLDCIWTLREATDDGWRLFNALPQLS